MQQFLSAADAAPAGISALIQEAQAHAADPRGLNELGRGKTLLNVFFNPSLRTRLSTEVAARNLGMDVMTLDAGAGWQLEFADGSVMDGGSAEHIREGAAVMSQYADILALRSFPGLEDRAADYADPILNAFQRHASRPVISLESAIRHPLQSLTDCLTIQQNRPAGGRRPRVVLTWAPHPRRLPQAVANSFSEWMITWDEVDFVIANPPGFDLAPEFIRGTTVYHNQNEALDGADFVYAKNWSAYHDYGATTDAPTWQITPEKMALTDNARFMHCLPVRRNVVVADAVLDNPRSLVIPQAGNRVWAAQAVLARMLRG